MKTNCVILLLLSLSCVLSSMQCRKDRSRCHSDLTFRNSTDKAVYVSISFDYPDTSLNFQTPVVTGKYFIGEHNQSRIYTVGGGDCLEYLFKEHLRSDKVSVFVFDANVLKSTPWTQVRQNYQVLYRFDFTIEQLIDLNFYIDFE